MPSVEVEWGVLEAMPIKIKAVKETRPDFRFYDFEQLDRLVLAAEEMRSPNQLLVALLGAEAGLRRGEMIGLEWPDVDLKRETLTVARTIWRRQEGPPKGGCSRTVPLAPRLLEALTKHGHLRSSHVLWTAHDGQPRPTTIRNWLDHGSTRAAAHLLLAPGHAGQAGGGHPGPGRTSAPRDDAAVHAPGPSAVRDAIEGLRRPSNWRHVGDGCKKTVEIK